MLIEGEEIMMLYMIEPYFHKIGFVTTNEMLYRVIQKYGREGVKYVKVDQSIEESDDWDENLEFMMIDEYLDFYFDMDIASIYPKDLSTIVVSQADIEMIEYSVDDIITNMDVDLRDMVSDLMYMFSKEEKKTIQRYLNMLTKSYIKRYEDIASTEDLIRYAYYRTTAILDILGEYE